LFAQVGYSKSFAQVGYSRAEDAKNNLALA